MDRPASLALLLAAAAALSACAAPAGAERPPRPDVTPSPAPPATPSPTSAVGPGGGYVAIGASDTVGVGAIDPRTGSWPARVAARLAPGTPYLNTGVSGSLAAQAVTEQVPATLRARPAIVTVWLAVNDLNAGLSPAAYREALDRLVGPLIRGTEARIFIGNVPDLRAVPVYRTADQAALLALVTAYNRSIADVAATHPGRVIVVDLFDGSADLISSATVAPDGFHPSDDGYRLIAERFLAALRAAGVPVRD